MNVRHPICYVLDVLNLATVFRAPFMPPPQHLHFTFDLSLSSTFSLEDGGRRLGHEYLWINRNHIRVRTTPFHTTFNDLGCLARLRMLKSLLIA